MLQHVRIFHLLLKSSLPLYLKYIIVPFIFQQPPGSKQDKGNILPRLCTLVTGRESHSFGSSSIVEASLKYNTGPHNLTLPRAQTGTPKLHNDLLHCM